MGTEPHALVRGGAPAVQTDVKVAQPNTRGVVLDPSYHNIRGEFKTLAQVPEIQGIYSYLSTRALGHCFHWPADI